MTQKTLSNLFDTFLEQPPHFKAKGAFQDTYTPPQIKHRDEQVHQLGSILMSALRGEKPSNVFIYGKTGTGKTLATRFVGRELEMKAKEHAVHIQTCYLNCKLEKAVSSYNILYSIATKLGLARADGTALPKTGLSIADLRASFVQALSARGGTYLLILDEIDSITDNDVLYLLTRMNTDITNAKVSLIGISNDLSFTNHLDPRVKSSLSEEELVFPPYNAFQLQDILRSRAELALSDLSILEGGTVPKCAALAAQEHGDARRALDLLRVACEIAERNGEAQVTEHHVAAAQKKLDIDRVVEVVQTQPKQSQLVLYSIFYLKDLNKEDIATGDVYSVYEKLCTQNHAELLTQRRVSDLIAELDMLGVINALVISKGRYGRTRKIRIDLAPEALEKCRAVLQKELLL